jgi:hypothetical protein
MISGSPTKIKKDAERLTAMVRTVGDPVCKRVDVMVAGTTRQEQALLRSLVVIVLISSSQLLNRHSGEVHSGSGAGQASM